MKADEKGLFLMTRWETQVPKLVYTDAARVRQALINLVGNAIKFTAKGSVEVIGRLTQFEGRPQIEFDVVDTGIGIGDEQLEKIFDPFVQADSSVTRKYRRHRPGTGDHAQDRPRLGRRSHRGQRDRRREHFFVAS